MMLNDPCLTTPNVDFAHRLCLTSKVLGDLAVISDKFSCHSATRATWSECKHVVSPSIYLVQRFAIHTIKVAHFHRSFFGLNGGHDLPHGSLHSVTPYLTEILTGQTSSSLDLFQ
jgi:hypothetical protein